MPTPLSSSKKRTYNPRLSQRGTFDKKRWRIVLGAAILTGISVLGSFSDFSGYSIRDLIDPYDSNYGRALSLTLFVHGPQGIGDILEEDIAPVTVTFGNAKWTKPVGANGEVHFEEIPLGFRDSLFLVSLAKNKFFELSELNKLYRYSSEPVYIEIRRISTISGYVKEENTNDPLEGATVAVDGDTSLITTTNRFGRFDITVPQDKAKLTYELIILKNNYTYSLIIYNIGSNPVEVFLKKIKL